MCEKHITMDSFQVLKWGIWIPPAAAADTHQIIPTPKSKYMGKTEVKLHFKKIQVHLHWSGADKPHPLSAQGVPSYSNKLYLCNKYVQISSAPGSRDDKLPAIKHF